MPELHPLIMFLLLLLFGSAAATPAGFALCTSLGVRTTYTGDTAFLFPDEIEHDGSGDTE